MPRLTAETEDAEAGIVPLQKAADDDVPGAAEAVEKALRVGKAELQETFWDVLKGRTVKRTAKGTVRKRNMSVLEVQGEDSFWMDVDRKYGACLLL